MQDLTPISLLNARPDPNFSPHALHNQLPHVIGVNRVRVDGHDALEPFKNWCQLERKLVARFPCYLRGSNTKRANKLALTQNRRNGGRQNDAEIVDPVPGTAQVRGKQHDQTLKKVDHLLGAPTKAGNEKSPTNQGLRRMVAWGGIEPPTQGFSILCSTD